MSLKFAATLLGAALLASPALAWSNAPMQPAGAPILVHPYPTSVNYCPSGLQPITLGGVICCGVPNTHETYYNHPGYRSGGTYIATGKGAGDGYIQYDKSSN